MLSNSLVLPASPVSLGPSCHAHQQRKRCCSCKGNANPTVKLWWAQVAGLYKLLIPTDGRSSARTREMRSSGDFQPSDDVLRYGEGHVVLFPSRPLRDINLMSWKWPLSWSWALCCVFIVHLLNSIWSKERARYTLYINLLENTEKQNVLMSPGYVSALF